MTKARDLANSAAAFAAVSATELAFVDGVTSAIQTQLDAKASLTGTQTLTNKTLTSPVLTTPTISTVNAKGDLLAGTADNTVDRLAVGNDGETIVADSSAATGLSYQENYAAGKNAIINGDFNINQRAFTSNTTSGTFNFDRWIQYNTGGSYTLTPQNFTPGAAPIAGYEGRTFLQAITASQSAAGDFAQIAQTIEGVNRYAGSTITVSFFAKANTGTPKIALELQQYFGTGGSPSATVNTVGGTITLTTSFARYSLTVAVPSISGKTIGTNNNSYLGLSLWTSAGSNFNARASSIGIQNFTASIWGVQVEDGSVATAFQTATGTIQGELAACQRYYVRQEYGGGNANYYATGTGVSTTRSFHYIAAPVSMRTAPSLAYGGTPAVSDTATSTSVTNILFYASTTGNQQFTIDARTASGLTQFRPYFLVFGGTGQLIELSAEL